LHVVPDGARNEGIIPLARKCFHHGCCQGHAQNFCNAKLSRHSNARTEDAHAHQRRYQHPDGPGYSLVLYLAKRPIESGRKSFAHQRRGTVHVYYIASLCCLYPNPASLRAAAHLLRSSLSLLSELRGTCHQYYLFLGFPCYCLVVFLKTITNLALVVFSRSESSKPQICPDY
jgi:hypothetical protein